MIEATIEIPQHLIYFYNLIKSYESSFGKNAQSLGMNTNEILILLEIYNNEGLNQIDIAKRYLITEANISQITKKLQKKEDGSWKQYKELVVLNWKRPWTIRGIAYHV